METLQNSKPPEAYNSLAQAKNSSQNLIQIQPL